ncbi:MAG: TonB-dependent receptor [Cyclobacteriaceae bacterium]|nr:TonB-dependent receptor [Cyclobacteriaceae bacterium]
MVFMKQIALVLTFLVFVPSISHAQDKLTINGYVRDASNGEALIGATVYVKEINNGVVTNVYGFYSITLDPGAYTVNYSYVGYTTQSRNISLTKNQEVNIDLVIESEQLEEVVVTAEREQANMENMEMSTNKLDIRTILKVPTFMGEADVFRSILLLPGVSTVGEGASGFNVRGGSVGQNLVLLDEAPVYNSSHLFGFFSVFNPDAVKDTKLYKGAIPSRYGGRLASLLDVRMKEGNSKKFEANGGIGSLFSRLAVEAPIVKDKSSFIVAARRSYIDVVARPFVPLLKEGGALNFYDLTLKGNYTLNRKNKLYASGYFGRDVFLFDANQGFSWGNTTGTLRWNHLFNERLFSNLTFVYSKYDYKLQFGEDDRDSFKWDSSISNFILKPQFTYFINSNNELDFGGEAIYYTFEPANAVGVSNGDVLDVSLDRKYNLETALYFGNRQTINDVLSVEYGLRFSRFQLFGPGKSYQYNDTLPGLRKTPRGFQEFGRGEAIADYANWEPRASFRIQSSPVSSVKGSYNRMAQYLHLISNTTASNPLDVWAPSSAMIKPGIGHQFTLGYFRDLRTDRDYEISVEGYYRATENQIDYIDGADLLINEFLEGELLSGKGRAYGVETYFQKKKGRLSGWISYTLGRTELKVGGINRGGWYPTRYDQLHNVKIAAFYDINERWSMSTDFVWVSGTPTTFPTSRFVVQDILIPYNSNGSRNNVRLPAYHRLDVSFRLEGKKVRRGKERKNTDYWVFSLYNVYARKNPFSIYFSQRDERVPPGTPIGSRAVQLSIVGTVVPSVSYNFRF